MSEEKFLQDLEKKLWTAADKLRTVPRRRCITSTPSWGCSLSSTSPMPSTSGGRS